MERLGTVCALILVAAFTGCAITDYPLITDTEGDEVGFIVNTNGKALIFPDPVLHGITLWPDQNEELFSLVDQQADGDQWITTHVNISYGEPKFMDFEYCNPDWKGCANMIAWNPNSPDDNPTDFVAFRGRCDGARSIEVTMVYVDRLGECGRGLLSRSGLSAMADWARSVSPTGDEGVYRISFDRRTLRLTGIDPSGRRHALPVYGNLDTRYVTGKGFLLRYSPALRPTALAAVRLTAEHDVGEWEIDYLGHTIPVQARVLENLESRVREY